MPVKIKQLNSRVTIRKGGAADTPLMQPQKAAKPSLEFALAKPTGRSESEMPTPSETATQGHHPTEAEPKAHTDVKGADVRAVADRVYTLMMEEMKRGKERGAR